MNDQEMRERVIKGLECHVHGHPHTRCHKCPYWGTGPHGCSECDVLAADALELLKAQELTIEPKRDELPEETKAWLDKMDAVEALGNIADICIDWDGYRTANGLGGLINEIWAYAKYCADKLMKAQEPEKPKVGHNVGPTWWYICGACNTAIDPKDKYCRVCGKRVKWDG